VNIASLNDSANAPSTLPLFLSNNKFTASFEPFNAANNSSYGSISTYSLSASNLSEIPLIKEVISSAFKVGIENF